MTAKVDKNGSEDVIEKQINIVRLRPRPRLPSEYRRQLRAGREEVENYRLSIADLNDRLDRLCESISQDDKAIPVELNGEREDSLVLNVGEALVTTR